MEEKKEIRFFLAENLHKRLKKKSEDLDIPLASYIKANVENWAKGVYHE